MEHVRDLFSEKNFIELSKEVRNLVSTQSWWSRHGQEWVALFARLALFALGYGIFTVPGAIFKIIGIVILSYAYYGIGITATHETSHLAFTKSPHLNRILSYIFSDFWCAQSSLWWHHRHVQVHHVYPNVPSKEKKQFYYPWLHKYVYFFITPFLVQFWLVAHSVIFLKGKWKAMAIYSILGLAGWLLPIYLFSLVVSVPAAIGYAFIMRSLFAPLFLHLSVFNHLGLENPATRLPWLPHQTKTTRNLRPHWILVGMGGNALVDCHIEHHLYPGLSNHILGKIRPIIKKYLQKEGYQYAEEGYWSCLKNCLHYYSEVFATTQVDI